MRGEVIAIGTELTTGAKLDTNSQWLSRELAGVGISIGFHTTVDDTPGTMVDVIRIAVRRADIVIITGGLGPTLDDLTRQALADVAHVQLQLDPVSLDCIERMFSLRNRVMPERNRIQAMFPAGSRPIPNPNGTAPGIDMPIVDAEASRSCRIFALPGVPSEMKPMFLDSVLPLLTGTGRVIRQACVHCFGLGESDFEDLLGDITARGRDPEVGITAHEATITLRITASGQSIDDCHAKLRQTEETIRSRLGHYVYGAEDDELEHVVIRLLRDAGATVATAECAVGLADRLTDTVGHEQCFRGGFVACDHAELAQMLGGPSSASRAGAQPPTQEIAIRLAQQCRAQTNADYAVSVTEYGSPDDAERAAAWVAIAFANGHQAREIRTTGNPAINRSRTTKVALDLLRLHLIGRPASR